MGRVHACTQLPGTYHRISVACGLNIRSCVIKRSECGLPVLVYRVGTASSCPPDALAVTLEVVPHKDKTIVDWFLIFIVLLVVQFLRPACDAWREQSKDMHAYVCRIRHARKEMATTYACPGCQTNQGTTLPAYKCPTA